MIETRRFKNVVIFIQTIFCNLCATKVNNNLEITSVRSSLDLGNKFGYLNWKTIYRHSFSLRKLPSRFFIFATRKP